MQLPIEVMQEAEQAPGFNVFVELPGIEAEGGLHAEHVSNEAFVLDVFTDQGKCFVASQWVSSLHARM